MLYKAVFAPQYLHFPWCFPARFNWEQIWAQRALGDAWRRVYVARSVAIVNPNYWSPVGYKGARFVQLWVICAIIHLSLNVWQNAKSLKWNLRIEQWAARRPQRRPRTSAAYSDSQSSQHHFSDLNANRKQTEHQMGGGSIRYVPCALLAMAAHDHKKKRRDFAALSFQGTCRRKKGEGKETPQENRIPPLSPSRKETSKRLTQNRNLNPKTRERNGKKRERQEKKEENTTPPFSSVDSPFFW